MLCITFLASQLERKFELEALQKENNANRIHELGKLQKEQSRQGQQLLSLDQGLSGKIQGKQLTMSYLKRISFIFQLTLKYVLQDIFPISLQ